MTKKTEETKATEATAVDYDAMTATQLNEHFGNWSKAIRGLSQLGYERKEIAAMLGKRYQHVRNVLVTKLTS